jgi:hypothetical protein
MQEKVEALRFVTTRREFLMLAGAGLGSAASGAAFGSSLSMAGESANSESVAVVWKDEVAGGEIQLTYAAKKSPGDFSLKPGVRRLTIQIDDVHNDVGALATRVTVRYRRHGGPNDLPAGFTFFLRDVQPETPILVHGLGVAVVPASDVRTYDQIEAAIAAKKLLSVRQRIDANPEDTYQAACRETKSMRCETWLGVGRDMRLFRVMPMDSAGYWGYVAPYDLKRSAIPQEGPDPGRYYFILGRGAQCSIDLTRRLEDGVLPIITSVQRDEDIEYRLTIFATLEEGPLSADKIRGTHWLAAFGNAVGAMLTDKEKREYESLKSAEVEHREQELICWAHVEITNRAAVPRYAYAKAGYVKADFLEGIGNVKLENGLKIKEDGTVMSINLLDGRPMPQEEMSVMLQPGQKTNLDILFPHRPLPKQRAAAVAKQSFHEHHQACRSFWQQKLDRGSRISLPEPAIEERVRAGLLHLDILTLGMAKEGVLATPVGYYAPIGSESSPIIQFYDALGYHDIAERAIQFFLNRQREDGFIQTCLEYQLETGPVLWTIGEHFRYTRDADWARRIQPHVLKACNFLLAWRRRNLREELRGKGFGLLEGKVADPEDFFHSYMLNALTYVGLKRAVEMYSDIDAAAFAEVKNELAPYLADIRNSYADNVVRSPVIPLGDGRWVPSFSPWAEYAGPVSLHADGGSWLSHFMFASRDSLIGSLFLGIGEVLDPNEQLAEWLLYAHQELMTHRNAGFSQPYYCRHDWLHMKRGEVKQFLKMYYSQFASLQDRETYTFWEHYVPEGESPHKTHEEGWFLMQTRWMLWNEDYDARGLRLLSMVPRAWLDAGKRIKLEKCASYFGSFSLDVQSSSRADLVEAAVEFHGAPERWPKMVTLRLPHPHGKRPRDVQGGTFNPKTESVEFSPASSMQRITLRY